MDWKGMILVNEESLEIKLESHKPKWVVLLIFSVQNNQEKESNLYSGDEVLRPPYFLYSSKQFFLHSMVFQKLHIQ